MSVPRQTDQRMKAEEFIAWSAEQVGDARYELLDGRIVAMALERVIHARAKNAVLRQFETGIAARGLPCEAFGDGMAVRVDDDTVFEPDVSVCCGQRLPDDDVLLLAPVIVVEVGSPSTHKIDALTKFVSYFRNPSIVHYLIVLANKRCVIYHRCRTGDVIESTHAYRRRHDRAATTGSRTRSFDLVRQPRSVSADFVS